MSDTITTSMVMTITIPLVDGDGTEYSRNITLENPNFADATRCETLDAKLHTAGYSTFFQPTGWDNQSTGIGVCTIPSDKHCEFKITDTTTTYIDYPEAPDPEDDDDDDGE